MHPCCNSFVFAICYIIMSSSSFPSSGRASKRLKTTPQQQQASLTSFFGAPKAVVRSQTTTTTTNAEGVSKLSASNNDDMPTLSTTTSTITSTTTSTSTTRSSDNSSNDATTTQANTGTTDAIIPQTVPWNASAWRVYENAVIYRKANKSTRKDDTSTAPRSKVAAFDMDGTLLVWRTTGWPSKLSDYELWNSAVITKLRTLYDEEGYQLVIISNQGAIRSAFTGKKATAVKSLIEWLIATIDRPISVVLSTDKKKGFHKPSVKLWQAAQHLFGSSSKSWSIADSFYVGDSVGDDNDAQGGVDIALARNVSQMTGQTLRFFTPDDYFGPSHAQQRQKLTSTVVAVPNAVLSARAALCSGNLCHQDSDHKKPLLLMLVGAQGSGKSTVAQRIVEHNPDQWAHFSQDTIQNGKPGKREQVEAAVERALHENKCVIVDRMHLDASQREPFVALAQRLSVPVHALVLNPPLALLAQRVKARQDHPGNVQGESGARMATASASKLVFPAYEEGFALVSATSSPDVGVDRFVQLYQQLGVSSSTSSGPQVPTEFVLASPDGKGNGVVLPAIVLGTMGMGRRDAEQIVRLALETGLRGVDTAPTYKNEDKVGNVLSKDTFVIVKVPKRATTAEEVQKELHTSLQSLQRPQADLLLLHWPSLAPESLKDVWQAMEAAMKDGHVKTLGICNANVAALANLLPQCRIPPTVVQIERHPLLPQWDVVDFCARHDIQVQAHTALGQGKSDLLEHEVIQQIASQYASTSTAQVLLSWNLQQGIAVVPKASSKDHLEELMRLPRLSRQDLQALNDISDRQRFVAPPFMYGSAPYCWGKQAPK